MGYVIGIGLALSVSTFARVVGFDRERVFYPTVLIVVAAYYLLFAVMGGSTSALIVESIAMGGFAWLAVAGWKGSVWLVVAGLAAHGVFDFFHAHIVHNPGVPEWWPAFCMAYDVVAAAYLAATHSQDGGSVHSSCDGR
ncbi:MAG: hypothetical protein ABI634_01175 [Acidobacteriota bacterium]